MSIENPTKRERERAAKALRKAADIISQPGGWCRGNFTNGKGGYCALGAIGKATNAPVRVDAGVFDDDEWPSTYHIAADKLGNDLLQSRGWDTKWLHPREAVAEVNDNVRDKRVLVRAMGSAAKELEAS